MAQPYKALALIVAVAQNGAIGLGNALPWRLPADLRRFKALTIGHSIVMGRRTFDSLARSLPGRQNIVVTRNSAFSAKGVDVARSIDEALALAQMPEPVFCIGGAEIFKVALPLANLAYVTEIVRDFKGDTFWPPLERSDWKEASRETGRDDAVGIDYAFVTYARVDARSAVR